MVMDHGLHDTILFGGFNCIDSYHTNLAQPVPSRIHPTPSTTGGTWSTGVGATGITYITPPRNAQLWETAVVRRDLLEAIGDLRQVKVAEHLDLGAQLLDLRPEPSKGVVICSIGCNKKTSAQ